MATVGQPSIVPDGNNKVPTAADIGLAEYARQIGRPKQTISDMVTAARVAENCPVDRTVLLDKTQHLAAIHTQQQIANSLPAGLRVEKPLVAVV